MATIERDVSLLQRRRVAPIYIVYGSAVQIRLNMIDYTIPANATVEFFAQCGSGPVYRADGSATGNSAVFTPPEGFFQQGDNALQLEINGRLIPLALDVKCEERISGVGSEETPEQVRPLVLQAQEAAKEASSAATRAAESASAAAGSASSAAGSADAAGKSAADALQSKNAAAASASAAAGSATAAAGSAEAAAGSAQAAKGSQDAAAGSAQEALTSKNAAASSAEAAASSAGAAAVGAEEALASKNAAAGSAQAAQEALKKAQAISVNPSYIGGNGNWYVWDTGQDSYVDSGVKAQGPKGDPGAVQTVCGVAPDASGNVVLDAGNVGAATKGYVDASVRKAAPRNLLDNSDFTNPVNQRGNTRYTGSVYTIDRWKLTGNTMNTGSDGVTLVASDSSSAILTQYTIGLRDGVYTQAVNVNGIIRTRIVRLSGSAITTIDSSNAAYTGGYVSSTVSSSGYFSFQIRANVGYSITFRWAALYEGEYTAETLPEYHPKGYGAELLECQRYYLHGVGKNCPGLILGDGSIKVFVPTPVTMRTTPTATAIFLDNAVYNNGADRIIALNSIASIELKPNGVYVVFNTNLTAGQDMFHTLMTFGTTLHLSADL